jgi:tetratricopeptide (TPR) repeat protein
MISSATFSSPTPCGRADTRAAGTLGRGSALSPVEVIACAQGGRLLIEDYRPLTDSLAWQLGQQYWLQRGSQAFISDANPVPFTVNNDGGLSVRAAELLFTSLQIAEEAGNVEDEILVLEFGIGVGLFARYFLDWFRHRCDEAGKDYYDRLCYIAADCSARMLSDACLHGVFLHHPGRYRLCTADAVDPQRALLQDPDVRRLAPRPFSAVFLNYVLDCLPATVLLTHDGRPERLHVRTSIVGENEWRRLLNISEEELLFLARSDKPEERRQLMPLANLLLSEYSYQPVEADAVPYAKFVQGALGRASGKPVLVNYGAMQSVEALLALLREGGFILINDYGQTKELASEGFEHQRFSYSTSVGLNFPLLKAFCADEARAAWIEPVADDTSLHGRVLMRQHNERLAGRFEECFGEAARKYDTEPAAQARELAKVGRLHAALGEYREAVTRQPFNWVLLNEVANFLTRALGNPGAGLEMARAAIAQNPACSPEVWNTAGDALFRLNRIDESRRVYLRALAIAPGDVRARYNLACVHSATGQYEEGLKRVAEALALDERAAFRDALLQKQTELLGLLDRRNRQSYQGLADRISPVAPAKREGGPVKGDAVRGDEG